MGVTVLGLGMAWFSGSYRVGPDEYGVPLAVAGQTWPYVWVWAAIGLTAAAMLRTVAARVPLAGPEVIAIAPTFTGARLSLGWRPEPPMLGAMAAAALAVAVIWCALALRSGFRGRGGAR
ncbi:MULTISPECIES: hypothetical protein [unclassified Streptomyces]|uniref:hypothetical protein n=1 Tax=unclassified Streptomyces TaxID=2593676 RepID=UPI00331F5782